MEPTPTPSPIVLARGPRKRWWRRQGAKPNFIYLDADGKRIRDASRLARIRSLSIPPAWREVRISPHRRSRLQALGLDDAGRRQYVYNPTFQARQRRKKFEKIERFGTYLPRLREATSRHLAQPGHDKERILAVVTRLVNELYFRAGSPRGVRRHRTYGITTLRSRHVRVEAAGRLIFEFDGKHHVHHRRVLVDAPLAALVAELKAIPGPSLFQYRNGDGTYHAITGDDLNLYVKRVTAPEFSAKDFRTWHGTLLVARELAKAGKAATKRELQRNVAQAVRRAAEQLGNTPAVCRSSYLHPLILDLYRRGITLEDIPATPGPIEASQSGHLPEELQLLELFHIGRVLAAQRRKKAAFTAHPTWHDAPRPEETAPEGIERAAAPARPADG